MAFRILVTMTATATLAVMGCSNQASTTDDGATTASAAPPVVASHSLTQGERPQMISGTVLETMDAVGYTYVRLDTADDELWAASNQFEAAAGDRGGRLIDGYEAPVCILTRQAAEALSGVQRELLDCGLGVKVFRLCRQP